MVTAETHAPMLTQCDIEDCQLNVNFEKQNPVLSFEKFPLLVLAKDTMTLQNVIIHI